MRRVLMGLACMSALFVAPSAFAMAQDFNLALLNNPATDASANAKFRMFANQLGAAVSGFNFSPPETLGHTGFNVAIDYGLAMIDNSRDLWPTESESSPNLLMMPTLHLRKGLGFSFELGGRLSYLVGTSLTAATAELKWALNEGFTYAPDFAVRGHATHVIGSQQFQLTTAGVDVGLGKQFALGGVSTLTPYIGWNLLFIYASSRMIDFAPSRNAVASPFDAMNVFETVEMGKNYSHRFYGGLRFIVNIVEIGAEFSYTGISVSHGVEALASKIDVFTFGGKIGVDF